MVIVGKIRGLGCNELDDHFVVKVMLEAFAPRNPTLVTLIRENKRFEEFSPNYVLGRILTHELMDKEVQHRNKIGELEVKLNNLKVKDVALHANKSSKPTTSSKHSTSSKPSKSKSKKVEVESSTSDSNEDDDESSHVEIGDMALFMKTYKRGLKKQGYKFAKRKFPNKKKITCCGSTEHFIADCPNEKRENKNDKGKGSYKKDKKPHHKRRNNGGEAHIGHEWNFGDESSSEGEGTKIATMSIKKPPSTSRLFDNLTDDEESSSIRCFMAKGEKVKTFSST
jgi:hypothetical protein